MSHATVTVIVQGKVVSPAFQLLSVDVSLEYNKITTCELTYIDGNFAEGSFPIADEGVFAPGNAVEIKLRYEGGPGKEKTVFEGIIIKQGLQMNFNTCITQIECSDKSIKMTTTRKSAIYTDKSDSDIFSEIIGNNSLEIDADSTSIVYPSLVQYYVTDWDFILSRAEANGLLVLVQENKVSIKKPPTGSPVKSFVFGIDEIFDFDFEADARHQTGSVSFSHWDVKDQKIVTKTSKDFEIKQGQFTSSKLAEVVGATKTENMSAVSMLENEPEAIANGIMIRKAMSMIRGRFKVLGTAEINVGDTIELKGMSTLFSGETIVTGIRHSVSTEGWLTDIQFGLSAKPFALTENIIDAKAAGVLPGVNGLQIGKVIKIEGDPLGENRIQIKLVALDADEGQVWARITSIYAGKESGIFFLPEIGDEVIVGFLNDDPRQPIILGSVNSSANPSPLQADEKNSLKGFVTVAGLKVLFNDEKKIITIQTTEENIITINEEDKEISIKDGNNNSIKMNKDGITMDSGKDVIIKSSGNIQMKASGNVEIKGSKIDLI